MMHKKKKKMNFACRGKDLERHYFWSMTLCLYIFVVWDVKRVPELASALPPVGDVGKSSRPTWKRAAAWKITASANRARLTPVYSCTAWDSFYLFLICFYFSTSTTLTTYRKNQRCKKPQKSVRHNQDLSIALFHQCLWHYFFMSFKI